MPHKEPDPSDPHALVGVVLPTPSGTTEEMAYVFAEEFARMGFDRERLMKVFSRPVYAGSHRAFQELGEKRIGEIVDECLAIWGRKSKLDKQP